MTKSDADPIGDIPIGPRPVDQVAIDQMADARAVETGIRRVLHIGRVGFIGGAENVLLTVASGLQERGIAAYLACPDGLLRERAEASGIVTIPIPLSRMRISANPLQLARYLRSWLRYSKHLVSQCRCHQIDLVHVHHPVTALYCSSIVKTLGLPLVFHLHEGPPGRPLYKLALRQAARMATRILCVSAAGMELLDAAGADASKATVIHNGVRDDFIRRSRDLQEPSTRSGGPRIAVIGMVEARKGHDVFVRAAARVLARHPGAVFEIVGDIPSNDGGRYKAELLKLIETLNLGNRVRLSAYREDIVDYMLGQDLIVSCSIGLESLSLVMLEAMALGRVIISTDIGGISEVVRDGVNGFIVRPGDVESLADGICRALDSSIVDVGRAAAATAQSQFSTAEMCRRIREVYAGIAQQRLAPR